MTDVIIIKLLVTELEKKYKTNYTKTHQLNLKTVSPIWTILMLITETELITKSLSDRLGLGQNSLPGAQQVRVAVKHTDQAREIPEYLRQISLGEEIEKTSYEDIARNRSFIQQVDGTVDSRDSLDQTV